MGKNKTIDTVIVRKVFEMAAEGKKPQEISDFFHFTRQWAENILKRYSPETFGPLVVNSRGGKRITSPEEDWILLDTAREMFRKPARHVLAEINRPANSPEKPLIPTPISRRTLARRLKEAGARTVKAIPDELTDLHKKARIEWANIRLGDYLLDEKFWHKVIFSDEVKFDLDPVYQRVRIVFSDPW